MEEKAHFLRDVSNSSAIRKHLIQNWNLANLPSKPRLLVHFYVMLENESPKLISWFGLLTLPIRTNFSTAEILKKL